MMMYQYRILMNKEKYNPGKLEFRTYQNLTQQQIEEFTTHFTESFISINKIWQKLKIPYQEVYDLMNRRVRAGSQYGFFTAMVNAGTEELAIIALDFDLFEYLKRRGTIYNKQLYPWWEQIAKLANQLENQYISSLKFGKGEIVYGDMAAVKVEYANAHIGEYFCMIRFLWMKQRGFKNLVGRCSSPISLKLMQRIGAKVVKKTHFTKKEMKDQFMQMIDLNFDEMNPMCLSRL